MLAKDAEKVKCSKTVKMVCFKVKLLQGNKNCNWEPNIQSEENISRDIKEEE